jgi:hypothetical protein
MLVQDMADDLWADLGAARIPPLGRGGDHVPLTLQQFRGRVPLKPQPPITADPQRPLSKEPVGKLFRLGERRFRAHCHRQPLGERIDHIRPRERARLGGQPVRPRELVQDLAHLLGSGRSAPVTTADLGELALPYPLLRQLPRPPLVDALLGFRVILGCAGRDRRGTAGLDPAQPVLGQPLVDLFRALTEPLDQRPIVQADNLRGTGALIHRTPPDTQPLRERRPFGRQVQVIGRHQMGVQPIAVQRAPAPIGALGGVLHQHMGVSMRVTGAADPVLERDPQQPTNGPLAVGAVVVASDSDTVALQVGDRHLQGLRPGGGDLGADALATAGGQQRDALGRVEAVVEHRHPAIHPLAAILPGPVEALPVQLMRVDAEDLAAQPLHGLNLHPS